MRLLLTNHALDVRAGSELATAELARELQDRKHEVAVFTMSRGLVAEQLQRQTGIRVLTPSDGAELHRFGADVIHVHHWPTALVLEALGVVAPWVIGFHGGIPALENAPPLVPGVRVPWWGMCEGTMVRVRGYGNWSDSPHVLIHNWFDDSTVARRRVGDQHLNRILVVSNHPLGPLWSALAGLARNSGLQVRRFGLPDRSRHLDAATLAGADVLVTTGRTAVVGQALGVPVLVAGHLGWDGWLTPHTRADIAARNYSGVAYAHPEQEETLGEWLSAPPGPSERRDLQDWVYRHATVSMAADRLEELYPCASTTPPTQAFGRWSEVVAGYALAAGASSNSGSSAAPGTGPRPGRLSRQLRIRAAQWSRSGSGKSRSAALES